MTGHFEPTNEQLWAQPPQMPLQPAPQPTAALLAHPVVPVAPAPVAPAPIAAVAQPQRSNPGGMSLALAIVSLVSGIPLTAIAADPGGPAGLLGTGVVWAGIVGVNFVFARGRRPSA